MRRSLFVVGARHANLQLSAMDVSVRMTMKGAAKCDKHCELQNSVNRQELERILCFREIPESMPASVCLCFVVPVVLPSLAYCCECLCFKLCGVLACSGASAALKHMIDRIVLRLPVF